MTLSLSRATLRALLVATTLLSLNLADLAKGQSRAVGAADSTLADLFNAPPRDAAPGVYWFFLDGNLSQEGMRADLDAMNAAGLRRAIVMEADQGGPRGDVSYMSSEWLDAWNAAGKYAQEREIELVASVGPGWCGAGGPWIEPDNAMQHLRASETRLSGGKRVEIKLPIPTPREPYFGRGSLGTCADVWENYYRDVAVIAFKAPKVDKRLVDWEEKALFYRPPFSSTPGVKPYLPPITDDLDADQYADSIVQRDSIVDLSENLDPDGVLRWDAPNGEWIVLRLGRRLTGQTTRPAPYAGLGLESDKFETSGIEQHFDAFNAKLLDLVNFSTLHHDSWEMSSQNWSENFRELFLARRGYDPTPWLPTFFGFVVESVEATERFLWDLRDVAAELVLQNNVTRMKELAAARGVEFSTEAYDLNPAGDLRLFSVADVPMCEFWSTGYGFDSRFSVFEAVSSAHTTGRPIVGAEAFTTAYDRWRQHPGVSKRLADWAFCAGVNRFFFHRMCAQPNDDAPGLSLGPHGMHFDRTATWFPLLGGKNGFIEYMTRVQAVLQRGVTVADALFLDHENAPSVFLPPTSATTERLDKKEYNFDGCFPQLFCERAKFADGKVLFPDGASYSVVVLPHSREMTLKLAEKLRQAKAEGVRIIGMKPTRTPGLKDRDEADKELRRLAEEIWTGENAAIEATYPDRYERNDAFELLADAKWLWGGDWRNVDVGVEESFLKSFQIDSEELENLTDASVVVAADNLATVKLNGEIVGEGGDFKEPKRFRLNDFVKLGTNTLEIVVLNEGDAPNPAGLVANLLLDDRQYPTDANWSVRDAQGEILPTEEIGAFDVSPWNMRAEKKFNRDSSYPDWEIVTNELHNLNLQPDFDVVDLDEKATLPYREKTYPIRWLHKRDGDLDVYFLANAVEEEDEGFTATCEFRVVGKSAQLWDPVVGKRYALHLHNDDDVDRGATHTRLKLRFEPNQSWFVVFTHDRQETAALPKITDLNHISPVSCVDLSEDWLATFNQNEAANRNFANGRETKRSFKTLENLKDSPEDELRYYSGIIVYEKSFDLDQTFLNLNADAIYLNFENVAVMARVELNDEELATLWHAPTRVEVPKSLLKATENRLKVTVANLWCNRLIGDASLPPEERFTRTSNPMWGPGDEQLQDSGLYGKATLTALTAKEGSERSEDVDKRR